MNPDESSGQGYSTAPPAYASSLCICTDLQCTSAIFGSVMKQRNLCAVPQVATFASSASMYTLYAFVVHWNLAFSCPVDQVMQANVHHVLSTACMHHLFVYTAGATCV